MNVKKDLIIVGAGPAGSSAAYTAANAGLNVLILDKEKWPRYKACGGALSLRTINILKENRIDIRSDLIKNEVKNFEFHFPGNYDFKLNYNKDSIKLINRSEFDDYLIRKAKEAGAEFLDRIKVKSVKEEENEVIIKTEDKIYHSSYLIGADGANSKISVSLNPERKNIVQNKGTALEVELKRSCLKRDNFKDTILVDFNYLDDGYSWLFPKKDYLSIGMGNLNFKKINLKKKLTEYLKSLNIDFNLNEIELQAHPIPVYSKEINFNRASKRILLAGDAAYLADALIGEGIYYALASGFTAAEIIAENFNTVSTKKIADEYKSNLKNTILTDLYAAEKAAGLFYHNKKMVRVLLEKRKDMLTTFMDAVQGRKNYNELGNLFKFLKKIFKF